MNDEEKSDYDKSFTPLINMIKEKLNDNGINIINKKLTRRNAILDHIYTNKMEKITDVCQDDNTVSDHSLIQINRRMKINNIEETVIETRNYKIINYDTINNNIINNEIYERLLIEDNTDFIT